MGDSQPTVLLVYGSRFGQSKKIALAVGEVLQERGVAVDVQELSRQLQPDPPRHVGFALVTSVRYGHFDPQAARFIDRYRSWLESVPTLLMTVSLTARNPEKRDPTIHLYTRKFLAKTGWTPSHTEVVAGALEYPRYNFFDRKAIQLIMHMTQGPTDPTVSIEYTDWDQVRQAAADYAIAWQ
ncbi:MAG: menaquinone-dependent protoporphyrinogen IX dehydrogenase [Propionibacteriaceae bacterium]|jgi:menaquinone-dependent protoporphyrinogen oxidase|nr:menaquinone-dependent protoporphyrinogen IX dehydrogenase [Propionibacteriaceae bacterium]